MHFCRLKLLPCRFILHHLKRLRMILSSACADEFIKGCPEVQSLAVRVEGWAAEPQVVKRVFLGVTQAADSFLRSANQALPGSLCGVVATSKAAAVDHFRLRQQDIFLLKWISGVVGGVVLKVEAQARFIRALRVAGSSATEGWCRQLSRGSTLRGALRYCGYLATVA